jgi:C-terminal processing protease CtpA/Prc
VLPFRKGFARPQRYTMVRDVVKILSVDGRMLEPVYAYLRLRIFQERTSQGLERTLERLHEEAGAPFEGLILELRDNPGGPLDQAVEVADPQTSAEGKDAETRQAAESYLQLDRALEILKRWTTFERLKQGQEIDDRQARPSEAAP